VTTIEPVLLGEDVFFIPPACRAVAEERLRDRLSGDVMTGRITPFSEIVSVPQELAAVLPKRLGRRLASGRNMIRIKKAIY
jgi:hypothetical protein